MTPGVRISAALIVMGQVAQSIVGMVRVIFWGVAVVMTGAVSTAISKIARASWLMIKSIENRRGYWKQQEPKYDHNRNHVQLARDVTPR